MAKPAVSRDAFRGLFALYAAKPHYDNDGENRLLKLFGSSDHIPDGLLDLWSTRTRTELLSPQIAGSALSPVAHEVASGSARYDHASDFLHRLLQEIDRKVH